MSDAPDPTVTGLVGYCTDANPGVDQWKRTKKHLILPHERLQPVPHLGAVVVLAHPEFLPIEYADMIVRQIPFALHRFPGANKFLLVHHVCGYYAQIPRLGTIDLDFMEEDVRRAAENVRKNFDLVVTGFFDNKDKGNDGFRQIV